MSLIEFRQAKPRPIGRTNLLDKGYGLEHIKGILDTGSQFVDVVKLGWGTSLVTQNLAEKLALYRSYDVEICLGGTLFEYAYMTNKIDEFIAYVKDQGLKIIEISDGAIEIPEKEKGAIIEKLAKDFTVYSEVGSKDETVIMSPSKWVRQIKNERAAGASLVILEGRESGTSGLYRGDGEIRMGLVDDIFESGLTLADLIFEAPQKSQQVWLLKQYGANVNMGNIALEDAISLETLRLGLRADTLEVFHGGK
ncbi:phosphosulfolactate synthase [Psychrosphaera sp. B3R10]|uniref:phosphosulfolactate synthase n=1 Tax=unclassified Psychrosphaera TaxID=2641570 RepID=UPI001C07FBB9|nr:MULTISPECIES: phosphosulfolactate synthase [unclassified Psychrosphaera]MBU2884052.1 phosphosulfolactate synthase [Psychrosphaera sp. I2R16]MBU2988182.1 phosphosulfolactate synthase [Psychrosphaera sp. B3R10]